MPSTAVSASAVPAVRSVLLDSSCSTPQPEAWRGGNHELSWSPSCHLPGHLARQRQDHQLWRELASTSCPWWAWSLCALCIRVTWLLLSVALWHLLQVVQGCLSVSSTRQIFLVNRIVVCWCEVTVTSICCVEEVTNFPHSPSKIYVSDKFV